MTCCDARLDALDSKSWSDALRNTSASHLFRQVGPWLGMDREKASYTSVIRVAMELNQIRMIVNGEDNFVTNQPTSEAIFDPWVRFLQAQNVQFRFGHTLVGFQRQEPESQTLTTAVVGRAHTSDLRVSADIWVLSLPVEVLCRIPVFRCHEQHNLRTLAATCLHTQTAIQVYFDRPVHMGPAAEDGRDRNSFMLTDSPWDLIVLLYDRAYTKETKLCGELHNVLGGWSVAVCTAYRPGLVTKKPFTKCTFEEMKEEIWAQLATDKAFGVVFQEFNGIDLHQLKSHIVHWAPIWPDFILSPNGLISTQPKFTNNAGSLALRPSYERPCRLTCMWRLLTYGKPLVSSRWRQRASPEKLWRR